MSDDPSAGVRQLLGPEGTIAGKLPGYEHRPEQLRMAEAVARALRTGEHLAVEAGTGVGKSFAYLLPAVLHAKAQAEQGPVIISTRTIALQQQLERKDLPFLASVLPFPFRAVTAVGRNHYVCLRRLERARGEKGLFDVDRQAQLDRVGSWAFDTGVGLRSELAEPVDQEVWEEVQAEHGNCLHQACPHFEPCHWQAARRRLQSAEIIVVNHALYCADLALRLAGTRYLPPHRVVIFDEAHHLERIATDALGLRVTRGTVEWHLRRLLPKRGRRLLERHGTPKARSLVHDLRTQAFGFFGDLESVLARSGEGGGLDLKGQVLEDPLGEMLLELADEVSGCATLAPTVDVQMELSSRATQLRQVAMAFQVLTGQSEPRPNPDGTVPELVRWVEPARKSPELRAAPLQIAGQLRAALFGASRHGDAVGPGVIPDSLGEIPVGSAVPASDDHPVCVLTSATLATVPAPEHPLLDDLGEPMPDPGFDWLSQRIGLDDARTLRLGGLDIEGRMKVVLEEALPDPGRDERAFLREAAQRIEDHVRHHRGRALILCTSWRQVQGLKDALRVPLQGAGYPLLVQGEDSLDRLVARKTMEPETVLLGTESLWEGIDVRGEPLQLVIVVRLPFASPGHPLARARLDAVRRAGRDPFQTVSLPEAVLRFRQGIGRLLRSSTDRGTLVVLDPRVRTKGYGRLFRAVLPVLEESPGDASDVPPWGDAEAGP